MKQKNAIFVAGTIGLLVLCIAGYSCTSAPAAPGQVASDPPAPVDTPVTAVPDTASVTPLPSATPDAAAAPSGITPAAPSTTDSSPAASSPAATNTTPPATASTLTPAPTVASAPLTVSTPTQQYVLDWSNRGLGGEYAPQWLKDIVIGDSTLVKKAYGLGDDDLVRFAVASDSSKNDAMTVADNNYAMQLANELKRTVLTQTGAFLSGAEFQTLNNAVSGAKVTLVGQRRLLDFWQLVETRNTMTGERTREYMYYIVYTVDKLNWDETVNMYVKELLGYLPADKIVTTQLSQDVAQQTSLSNVQDQQALLDQLEAQLSALEQELSTGAQQQAYSSGDSSRAAAASVTPDDYEWINAMIQSSQLLFQ
jgi:hypothetical protein